jgi:hypothetical protein
MRRILSQVMPRSMVVRKLNGAAFVHMPPRRPHSSGDTRELRGGFRRKVRPLLPVNRGGVFARNTGTA